MEKRNPTQAVVQSEIGVSRPISGRDLTRVVLVYPNVYSVGMTNLGFQTVYRLLNDRDGIVCERSFLPEDNRSSGKKPQRVTTVESGGFPGNVDILAFSISFENDYINILKYLSLAGLPLRSSDRGQPHPLVIAGGVACMINPEAISSFIDCFFIGEAEVLLPAFIDSLDSTRERHEILLEAAKHIPGVYVPAFYEPEYHEDGTLQSFEPVVDVPSRIRRMAVHDLSAFSTESSIIASEATFSDTFLIETGRGCPRGCRFCAAGYVYRPPRERPMDLLRDRMEAALSMTNKIGLVGATVSDLPDVESLLYMNREDGSRPEVSFSSFRADCLSDRFIAGLAENGVKTAVIAPEAGSDRMRRIINKGLEESDILSAAERLVFGGVPNLKLYFMIGLPWETIDDVEAIVDLSKRIKHRFLKSSRIRKHMGTITISLNTFVPKPATPFQWAPADPIRTAKDKIQRVKKGLKGVSNVRVHGDVPKWAHIQTLMSRGNRKVAGILEAAYHHDGNWAQTLKETPVNSDFFILREFALEELLPWDFIDHGVEKSYLIKEYNRAKAEKTTPVCKPDTCRRCGVCNDGDTDDTPDKDLQTTVFHV